MRLVHGRRFIDMIREYHGSGSAFGSQESELRGNELLRHFISICQALAYAHKCGVVHRDLKPHNVVVGAFGEAVVLDWGLAISFGPAMESRVIRGPRRVRIRICLRSRHRGRLISEAHFGLGTILYVILTGRAPYSVQEGEAKTDPQRRVLEARFPRPRDVNSNVPRDLEAVCLKAMALKQEDRYDSALGLSNDVERWLADEPVQAYREPRSARVRRWARRHRTVVASATGIIVVGLVCALVIAGILHRSELMARERLQEDVNEARIHAATLAAQGRFGEAANNLTRAIQELKKRPGLLGGVQSIEARRGVYLNMETFRESADNAWFSAGEERGDETLEACRAALGSYGVLENSDWAQNLSVAGLPDETITNCEVRGPPNPRAEGGHAS